LVKRPLIVVATLLSFMISVRYWRRV